MNGQCKTQTVDYYFHHANENETTIVPLFSNPNNNSTQSAFYTAPCLIAQSALIRASDKSQRKKSSFAGFSGTNSWKIGRFCRIFAQIFGVDFSKKQKIIKKYGRF